MMRSVCCFSLACLFAACAPPKALLVDEETPVAEPRQETVKPASGEEDSPPSPEPLVVRQGSGMRVPDLTGKLPDKKDMTPTVTPKNTGGPVIATPPKDGKPVSE